jgi:hypothetical protein
VAASSFCCLEILQSGGLIHGHAPAYLRNKQSGKQQQHKHRHQDGEQRTQRKPRVGSYFSVRQWDVRQMSTQHVRAPAERVITLVHGVAAEHRQIAADPRLRINHRIPANHRSSLCHMPGHIQTAEQHKDASRQVALHLHRTEDTRRIMYLLAGGNVNVLADIGSTARRLAQRGRGEQKHTDEAADREIRQVSPKEITACTNRYADRIRQVPQKLSKTPAQTSPD